MNNYVTGSVIKELREKLKLTQRELGSLISVGDKAISKWETGRGLPDITLLEPLAKALKVSVTELISGKIAKNTNVSANMLKTKFYVCPICGNIISSTGEGLMSCCGVTLPVTQPEENDNEHIIEIEQIENEHFVTINHPMTKEHYISFIAYVNHEKLELIKLYPEGNAESRIFKRGRGVLYAYCNMHGLYMKKI